ncbi:MAG TPA: hypothetical protein GXX46_12880 [Peptococcaceae bacterium]|nr:hypothetical protein [Peptococcaceae bacterium]
MKKDKEIWLEPEEIQQLLEGGLYWKDIEPKLYGQDAGSVKRQPAIAEEPNLEEIETVPDQDVRAILFGEKPLPEKTLTEAETAAASEENNKEKENKIEDIRPYYPKEEGPAEEETKVFPGPAAEIFTGATAENELKDLILRDEEEEEEEGTPFGGLKLILLLIVVAVLTFGFWFYFLNR